MRSVLKSSVSLLVCLALLAGCQANREQNAELFIFGTIIEIKLWGVTQEQGDHAFSQLQEMFNGMHRDWHAWEPGRLTDINQAFAAGRTAACQFDTTTMGYTASDASHIAGRPSP